MPAIQELLILEPTELQDHVGVSGELSIQSLKPDLLDVQENVLQAVLGDDFYEEIKGWYYSAGYPAGSKEADCIFRCQKIIANLAMAQYQNIGQLKITDAGYTQMKTQTSEPVRQWQIDDLREYLYFRGYRAIDALLKFLEKNKAYFTTWANDAVAYTINKKFIVDSADTMQVWHDIQNSRRTYLALLPIMRSVEMFSIETALCPDMYARVKEEIKSADISDDVNKILPYLQAAVTKFTISKAAEQNIIEIRNDGLYVRTYKANTGDRNNRERINPGNNEIYRLQQSCEAEAKLFLQKAVDYLQLNASETVFPEFFESECYITEEDQDKIDYENSSCRKIFLM